MGLKVEVEATQRLHEPRVGLVDVCVGSTMVACGDWRCKQTPIEQQYGTSFTPSVRVTEKLDAFTSLLFTVKTPCF